jgi:pimeloyl-ACP methyl ester carboxylesterase
MDKLTKIKVAGIPEGFQELSFTTDEVTLNYVVGPDNGSPLLLIPGQMESWQGYKPVLPELSKRFHVFVPDLRGHGKSTGTPGHYSYDTCGSDLKHFIQEVIQQPALVAGLSSGGVLAIWLAAYASEHVLVIISVDPPIFSSIWPRIQYEKLMTRNFKLAVDILGTPGKRDVRPECPYDTPFLPYNMRAGNKFLSEYDTDFSRATIDGDLSKDFDPEATLNRVKRPMLLLRADASRHETWGLLGAIDANDLECIVSLVDDLQVVQIPGGHEIHLVQPRRYIDEIEKFVDALQEENKLS